MVVPTYNRHASLQRLLAALDRQTFPMADFEVVVVDDGSSDGTVSYLRQQRRPYPLHVEEQAHAGPAAARNLGVAHSRGRLILFLDDDVVPAVDLISAHVAVQQAPGGANIVAIGPMSPPGDWPRPAWIRWEETQLDWQYRALVDGVFPCGPRQFYTGNTSLPQSLFLQAQGFDTRFTRGEDVELGYRMRDLGAQFVFVPQADVRHYASRTLESWCRTPYQYGRFDVVMHREKGHEALRLAVVEFRRRHPLNQLVARLCVGRWPMFRGAVLALQRFVGLADLVDAQRPARLALSALFNLLYWQGVCDELGGRRAVWGAVGPA